MKPGIVNIIYFVLALLLFGAVMQVGTVFNQKFDNGYSNLYNASVSMVLAVASLVSIVALAKKAAWARMTVVLVVGLQAMALIGSGLFLAVKDNENGLALSFPFFLYGAAILFLAYKAYSSKPLKEYLGTA